MSEEVPEFKPPSWVRAFFESKWWIALWLLAAAEWLELLK